MLFIDIWALLMEVAVGVRDFCICLNWKVIATPWLWNEQKKKQSTRKVWPGEVWRIPNTHDTQQAHVFAGWSSTRSL